MNFYEKFSNCSQDMTVENLEKSIEEDLEERAIRIQIGVKNVEFDLENPGHVIVVYKRKGKYIIYDPNNEARVEQTFDSPEKAAQWIYTRSKALFKEGPKEVELYFEKSVYMDLNKGDYGIPTETVHDKKEFVEENYLNDSLWDKQTFLESVFSIIKNFLKQKYHTDIKSKEELFDSFIEYFKIEYPHLEKFFNENRKDLDEKCKETLWNIFINVRETFPSRMIRPHVHKAIADLVDYITQLIYTYILRYPTRDNIIESGVNNIKRKF